MNLAERLRERREKRRLRNGQVALYLGITTSYVSQMENGKKQPSLEVLTRLAKYYDTSADYLLGLTDDPSPRSDEPLPEVVRDVIEIMLGLSEGRRAELLAHARVLDEAEAEATSAFEYQVLSFLESLPNSNEVIAGFREALRTASSGRPADIAAAERIIDALAASQTAKKAGKEPVE